MSGKRTDAKSAAGNLVPISGSDYDRMQHEAFLRSKGVDPRGPIQLEMWPAEFRQMPNDYARSSLFTIRNKSLKRESLEGVPLFHIEKAVRVTFTGIELRADDDELVWLQILEYAKVTPLGEPVRFNLHALCKDLKWSVNARNYNRMRACISRLKASEVKVDNERIGRGVALSLIREYETEGDKSEGGTRYTVWIHPNLIILFAGRNSTRLEWDKYRQLTPIERRLYDYAASHKQPFPLRLDTFSKLAGSTATVERKWRAMVRAACAQLVAIGLVKRAWVSDDLIYFERN